MKKLIYYQELELRDSICKILISGLTDIGNWELQGRNMYLLGFDVNEARYPTDTYVGQHRLDGYLKMEKEAIKEVV